LEVDHEADGLELLLGDDAGAVEERVLLRAEEADGRAVVARLLELGAGALGIVDVVELLAGGGVPGDLTHHPARIETDEVASTTGRGEDRLVVEGVAEGLADQL